MDDRISPLHRMLLWLAIVPGGLYALGYYFAPVATSTALGADAPDPAAIRSIGGFLIGAAVAAVLALRSGKWCEVRIGTFYVMTWNLLNCIGLLYDILTGVAQLALLPNVVLLAIFGVGFTIVCLHRSVAARQNSMRAPAQ
jgi:hypothetical protein